MAETPTRQGSFQPAAVGTTAQKASLNSFPMHLSAVGVFLFVAATLFVGCASPDDGDSGGAELSTTEQTTSTLRDGTYGTIDVAGISGSSSHRLASIGGRSVAVRTPFAFD